MPTTRTKPIEPSLGAEAVAAVGPLLVKPGELAVGRAEVAPPASLRSYRRLGSQPPPPPRKRAVDDGGEETLRLRIMARQRAARCLRDLARDLPYLERTEIAERLRTLAEDFGEVAP